MTRFIETCNCKGRHPSGIVEIHHNLRSNIVGRMLKDRHAARFLVAPKGYGKSSIAYEYAQIVFGFEHVFWIRCESPCFLRDLDDGCIFEGIGKCDREAKLVVFDDVPGLDPARTEAFCSLLDGILESGCEAIVTCVPSADTFSGSQKDRLLLSGNDLLLSDDEIELERMRGNLACSSSEDVPLAERAAGLIWGSEGAEGILKGLRSEELTSELELAIFMMLLLKGGQLEELIPVLPGRRLLEDIECLGDMYPYLGIDSVAGTFDSMGVPAGAIASASKISIDSISGVSAQGERAGFCIQASRMLFAKGMESRACEFMESSAEKSCISRWLAADGWKILASGNALSAMNLLGIVSNKSGRVGPELLPLKAWAALMLHDFEQAEKIARMGVAASRSEWEVVAPCATLLSRIASDGGKDASKAVTRAMRLKAAMEGGAGIAETPDKACFIDWDALSKLEFTRRNPGDFEPLWAEVGEQVRKLREEAPSGSVLHSLEGAMLAAAAWILEDLNLLQSGANSSSDVSYCRQYLEPGAVNAVVKEAAEILRLQDCTLRFDWASCIATSAMEEFLDANPYIFDSTIPAGTVAASRKMSLSLVGQRSEYRRSAERRSKTRAEYEITHPDTFRKDSQPESAKASLRVTTPVLNISLFGGMDVWIGDDAEDSRTPTRSNVRTILAMLVLAKGREVSKRQIAETLWPAADIDAGIRNLYTVWGHLKRGLSVGGSCPYLLQTQSGYRLDFRHVATDMEAFDDLCKALLFGHGERALWEEMFEKVSRRFSGDMLPDIRGVDFIDAMRSRCRTQLIDGLVAASVRLSRDSEHRGAAWFAREALRRDRSREDAYIALMDAQIASHQRAAALDTYFECRKYLSEELGIDPSAKVMELYRSIIETEEEF